MSSDLLQFFFDEGTQTLDKEKFLYRKDSVAIEINRLFEGCVIYVERAPYQAKSFWRIQAYCTHKNCRKFRLIASYDDRRKFKVFVDKLEPTHTQAIARQIRRYERDQQRSALTTVLPNQLRQRDLRGINDDEVASGSYGDVVSLDVYQKIRQEALAEQDKCKDDYEDVLAMITDNPDTNFISNVLCRKKLAVYIHSKSQHTILHKLHCKREQTGIPITARIDATKNIARSLKDVIGQFLYYALTINVTIKTDRHSTAFPLTEQYNVRHNSKDIAMWLKDFILSHHAWYDNPPLLIDFIISDFSYANFHGILLAFNSISLSKYLNTAYEWVMHKIQEGDFPDGYSLMVKIRMCFTHLMHTYAEMCKRHYGKTKDNKQVKASKIILEILGSMIKATNYMIILKLWKQLVILMTNEFQNDDVVNAISEVNTITTTNVILDDYAEEKLTDAVDVGKLPENQHTTLYANNKFYLEFSKIQSDTKPFVYGNVEQVKNEYYNPKFLEKFLKRFVPLLPLWTKILKPSIVEDPNSDIRVLQLEHNQPIESYFGTFKFTIATNSASLGRPPIKLGRAIEVSRGVIDATVNSIQSVVPKNRLNSQHPRKPYTKKGKINDINKIAGVQVSGKLVKGFDSDVPVEIVDGVGSRDNNEAIHVAVSNEGAGSQGSNGVSSQVSLRNVTDKNQFVDKTLFKNAHESFKKKFRTPQSYLQGRRIQKIASQKPVESAKTDVFRSNGLFKDIDIYSGLGFQFIVAKSNGSLLSNTSFDTLRPFTDISKSLMEYIIQIFPKSVQLELNKTEDIVKKVNVTVKLTKKIIFLILYEDHHWLLFILNKEKKTFAMLNPTHSQLRQRNFFSTFSSYIKEHNQKFNIKSEEWTEISIQHNKSDNEYDSGIYIYDFMMQYKNTANIKKTISHADVMRKEIKLKLLQLSENMRNACLICGSLDETNMVECTKCARWIHDVCVGIKISSIKVDDIYNCPICEVKF